MQATFFAYLVEWSIITNIWLLHVTIMQMFWWSIYTTSLNPNGFMNPTFGPSLFDMTNMQKSFSQRPYSGQAIQTALYPVVHVVHALMTNLVVWAKQKTSLVQLWQD